MRRALALVAAVTLVATLLLGVGSVAPAGAAPGTWLSRINRYRAQNGLGPLIEDAGLDAVAQGWTQTMAGTNILAHNPVLSVQLPQDWVRFGENVGRGTTEAALFETFVSSPSHRAHLLGAYNGIGIGQVMSGGRLWTSHVFVMAPSVRPAPPPSGGTVAAAGRSLGGLWTATSTGTVAARAGAPTLGDLNATPNLPIVGISGTRSGSGYWLVAADGGIFAFGDADFFGSTGGLRLNQRIIGMTATPSGLGYWLVAADGGIFAFGDARFFGSTGAFRLNQPIVGMAATPSGLGYWLVAADGGIFAFGDARFYGSTAGVHLASPVTGISPGRNGAGYRLVAADGGIFRFGDAPFFGSLGGTSTTAPVVAMAATSTGEGYWLAHADGSTSSFGDAPGA